MATNWPWSQAVDEAQKVVQRQAVCQTRVQQLVDTLKEEVTRARSTLASLPAGANPSDTLQHLKSTVGQLLKDGPPVIKDLHSSIGKVSKVVDTVVSAEVDYGAVLRDVPLDSNALNKVIAQHYFRQGRFDVGECLVQEGGLSEAGPALAAPFTSMHTIVQQLHQRNPEPALQWATAQLLLITQPGAHTATATDTSEPAAAAGDAGDAMQIDPLPPPASTAATAQPAAAGEAASPVAASGAGGEGGRAASQSGCFKARNSQALLKAVASFQFRLHALTYLTLLTHQGPSEALGYARLHMSSLAANHMKDFQHLMGCLVFCKRQAQAGGSGTGPVLSLAGTPYAHLLPDTAWQDCAREFVKLACSLMGMAAESPLATVLAAGAAALPKLHKLLSVLAGTVAAEVKTGSQLPVELELGPEFVFNPIFACPVSREQSTPDNPPMLLPCNHVLCEQSVYKIAKSRNRVFKCPYCPVEARADNLRALVFPPLD